MDRDLQGSKEKYAEGLELWRSLPIAEQDQIILYLQQLVTSRALEQCPDRSLLSERTSQ